MPISFPCPKCDNRIHVSRKHAGKTGRCPKCSQALGVPTLEQIAELTKAAGVEVSESAEDLRPTDSGEFFREQRVELEQEKIDLAWQKLEFEREKLAAQAAVPEPVEEPEPTPRRPVVAPRRRVSERLQPVRSGKSAGTAAVLSLLVPGAGALYAGSAVVGVLLFLIGMLAGVAVAEGKDARTAALAVGVHVAQAVIAVGIAADTHRR